MPKAYSAKKVILVLYRAGFSIISQRGSYIKLHKKVGAKNYTAIVPNHKEIAIGTFKSILRQAGMSKEEFEKFIK